MRARLLAIGLLSFTVGCSDPAPGEPGAEGPAGPAGPAGPVGPEGPAGVDGATGPVGPAGPVGPQGAVGPAGAMGAAGAMGPAGAQGAAGPVGAQGPQGAAGPAGMQGAPGAAGPAGPQGAVGPAGPTRFVNITIQENATRAALPTACSITLESFTVDKLSATSFLLIEGSIAGWGDYSGSMTQGWRLGTGIEAIGQPLMYATTAHSKVFPTRVVIRNHGTTGPQALTFRYFTADPTGCGNRPFNTYNPNATDDPRLAQTRSVYTVWELEP